MVCTFLWLFKRNKTEDETQYEMVVYVKCVVKP